MVTLDRIRLTGLLRESPAPVGLFYRTFRYGLVTVWSGSLSAVSWNRSARAPGRRLFGCAGFAPPRRSEASKRPGRPQTIVEAGPGRERRGRLVELLRGDVGVAADRGEVGVTEVGGDQPRVTARLPQPGGGAVAERVCGHSLLEPGPLGGAADDRGEDRRLQALALEAAEDGRVRGCVSRRLQASELARQRPRERLPAGLAALAAADEQRRSRSRELEVGPVERDQLRAAQAGLDEREQHEAVALGEAAPSTRRVLGRGQQPGELQLGQPVGLLLWLRRRLELEEGVRQTAAPAQPAEETAQQPEAAVVGRRRRSGPLLVGGEVVDDRPLFDDALASLVAPGEKIVDRDPVGGDRALAAACRLQAAQPVVTRLTERERGRGPPDRRGCELAQASGKQLGDVVGCRCRARGGLHG